MVNFHSWPQVNCIHCPNPVIIGYRKVAVAGYIWWNTEDSLEHDVKHCHELKLMENIYSEKSLSLNVHYEIMRKYLWCEISVHILTVYIMTYWHNLHLRMFMVSLYCNWDLSEYGSQFKIFLKIILKEEVVVLMNILWRIVAYRWASVWWCCLY